MVDGDLKKLCRSIKHDGIGEHAGDTLTAVAIVEGGGEFPADYTINAATNCVEFCALIDTSIFGETRSVYGLQFRLEGDDLRCTLPCEPDCLVLCESVIGGLTMECDCANCKVASEIAEAQVNWDLPPAGGVLPITLNFNTYCAGDDVAIRFDYDLRTNRVAPDNVSHIVQYNSPTLTGGAWMSTPNGGLLTTPILTQTFVRYSATGIVQSAPVGAHVVRVRVRPAAGSPAFGPDARIDMHMYAEVERFFCV